MQKESAITECRINGIKMNFNLNSLTYGPIVFQPVVPAYFANLVVPGNHVYNMVGVFRNVLPEKINAGGIAIELPEELLPLFPYLNFFINATDSTESHMLFRNHRCQADWLREIKEWIC
jgi:hypothetical protein